jgi:hypothetical protein
LDERLRQLPNQPDADTPDDDTPTSDHDEGLPPDSEERQIVAVTPTAKRKIDSRGPLSDSIRPAKATLLCKHTSYADGSSWANRSRVSQSPGSERRSRDTSPSVHAAHCPPGSAAQRQLASKRARTARLSPRPTGSAPASRLTSATLDDDRNDSKVRPRFSLCAGTRVLNSLVSNDCPGR